MSGTDDARSARERYAARVRGCLLGGAIGDALGAPVEFWPADRILAEVGPGGVRSYLPIDDADAALSAAGEPGTGGPGPSAAVVARLGEGWVAEEALAVGVYAALAFPGPDQVIDALALAVSHGGDSDSTGSICGNLLGAWHGDTALPPVLTFEVEGRGTILQLADDLVWELTVPHQLHGEHGPTTRWIGRY